MVMGDIMTAGMRRALTDLGARELRTPDEVDAFMTEAASGTALLAVNSSCGCAGGGMRPAVGLALARAAKPRHFATVFASQDVEATTRAREYIRGYPPSSPSVALFKDGEVVYMLERGRIQGRMPEEIAADLAQALDAYAD
jgi:putative YphP/YqiW family bacilliredoxin